MQFIKFLNENEIVEYEKYIKSYAALWVLSFKLMRKVNQMPEKWEFINESLDLLKGEVIRVFRRCRNYDLLKISPE